jgi:hypothetical protein
VPGASSPYLDTWAPAQFVAGSSGGQGPVRSPDPVTATLGALGMNGSTYDGTLHYKLAGTIVLALLVVFGLQLAGFRFVGAVNVGFGK